MASLLPNLASREAPFDVVGLGEISVDHLSVVPRMPGVDDKVRMARYEVQGGGQIATAMVACRRLGLKAKFLGKVGDDAWGRWSIDALTKEGVDASGVRVSRGPTQTAFVLIHEQTGARTVIWHCDPGQTLRPDELSPAEVAQGRVFHVDATGLAGGLEPLRWARAAGVATSIDIDHRLPDTEAALRLIDLCVLPEAFARELTGARDVEGAARGLQRIAPGAVVCVTSGENGCAALDGDALVVEPAFAVKAVDTTSCGDVFHAAFIRAALAGLPLREAMRFSNAAAALNATKLGGRPGNPTLPEVEELLRAPSARVG